MAEKIETTLSIMQGENAKDSLKPCPFCGGTLEVDRFRLWTHPDNDCLLATIDEGTFPLMLNEKELVKWNRRADNG